MATADLGGCRLECREAVDKTVDGLKKGVDDTLGGLTNPLQPKK